MLSIAQKIVDIHDYIFSTKYDKITISYYDLNHELEWAFDPVYGMPGKDFKINGKRVKRLPSDRLANYKPDANELLVVYYYNCTDQNDVNIRLLDADLDSVIINSINQVGILITADFRQIAKVINTARNTVLDYIYKKQQSGEYTT